jgi:hypothetical protein
MKLLDNLGYYTTKNFVIYLTIIRTLNTGVYGGTNMQPGRGETRLPSKISVKNLLRHDHLKVRKGDGKVLYITLKCILRKQILGMKMNESDSGSCSVAGSGISTVGRSGSGVQEGKGKSKVVPVLN